MPTVQFPSAQAPALTGVDITAPESWIPIEVDNTVLALARPGEPGEFLGNVIVVIRRFPSSYTLETAVNDVEASFGVFADVQNRGGGAMQVGGFPGYARELTYVDAEVGPLAHSVRVAVVPVGGVDAVDVVDVRGTVLLSREDPDHLEVIDLLQTLVLRNS